MTNKLIKRSYYPRKTGVELVWVFLAFCYEYR